MVIEHEVKLTNGDEKCGLAGERAALLAAFGRMGAAPRGGTGDMLFEGAEDGSAR
jgi:hypothetical protein